MNDDMASVIRSEHESLLRELIVGIYKAQSLAQSRINAKLHYQTLELAKEHAPRVRYFEQRQYIVKDEDGYVVLDWGAPVRGMVDGRPIVSRRGFDATGYANDHQGPWQDAE